MTKTVKRDLAVAIIVSEIAVAMAGMVIAAFILGGGKAF
jgi:hypothetical protein